MVRVHVHATVMPAYCAHYSNQCVQTQLSQLTVTEVPLVIVKQPESNKKES